MNGIVFLAAIISAAIIFTVVGVGRRVNRVEIETGTPSKWMDPLIYGSAALALAALYFRDAHPLVGYTLAIITGFLCCYGLLVAVGLIARFLKRE